MNASLFLFYFQFTRFQVDIKYLPHANMQLTINRKSLILTSLGSKPRIIRCPGYRNAYKHEEMGGKTIIQKTKIRSKKLNSSQMIL